MPAAMVSRKKTNKLKPALIESLETRRLLTGVLDSTVAISDTAAFIQQGSSETFTVTVTPVLPNRPTPTGTIEFNSSNGVYPSQSVPLQSNGTAQLTVQGTIPGYMGFYALYSGDANYAVSQSVTETVPVDQQAIQPTLTKNTFPNSIVQGSTKARASTTVELSNPTNARITGPQTITISASGYLGNGAFNTQVVGSVKRNVNIGPGGNQSFSVPVNMQAADGTAASYYLLPSVTNKPGQTSYQVQAGSGVNPAVTVEVGFVDLSAALTIASPKNGQALPGKPVTVSLEIFNSGNIYANGPSANVLAASSNRDGSSPIFSDTVLQHLHIAPGGHAFYRITEKIPLGSIPGSYFLSANVDSTNSFGETNLANNMAVSPIQLTVLDPYPAIQGNFSGTYKVTHGVNKGLVATRIGQFFAEDDTNGAFGITGTNFFRNGTSDTINGSGTISTSGVFKSTITQSISGVSTAAGRLSKGVIRGSFKAADGDTGTFVWTLG